MDLRVPTLIIGLALLTACPVPGPDTAEPVGGPCDVELPEILVPAPVTCPVQPPTFDPEIVWEWSSCNLGVTVTPALGDMNGDGVSDVVFTAHEGWAGDPNHFVILDGTDGSELVNVDELSLGGDTWYPSGIGSVALGDVDGDGTPAERQRVSVSGSHAGAG